MTPVCIASCEGSSIEQAAEALPAEEIQQRKGHGEQPDHLQSPPGSPP